jgi:hypothetical protein
VEEPIVLSRDDDNRDYLKGANYPRQSYALSGMQWGDSVDKEVRGKRTTDGPPMIVTPTPPGALAFSDDAWKINFGASSDAFLSLVNGSKIQNNKTESAANVPDGVFKKIPSIAKTNTYELLDGKQQIQYVVSKDTIDEASEANDHGPTEGVRGLGIRAPSIMAGWGYTTAMLPTDPDPADPRDNDNEHKFDRATWEEGPIDLRWDPLRKMWRGWNDLIADNSDNFMGTFVFGSNQTGGVKAFPFQRGALDDVWRVLYTDVTGGAVDDNGVPRPTAEVCTQLDSRLYDKTFGGAHKMNTILACRPSVKTTPVTVGEEAIVINGDVEIRTTAPFWQELDDLSGPILFLNDEFNIGETTGTMKFKDGFWVPTFNLGIDTICTIPGVDGAFLTFWDNDVNLGELLEDFSDEVCTWVSDEVQGKVNFNFTNLATVARVNNAKIANFADDINTVTNDNLNSVMVLMQLAANALTRTINAGLENIAVQVNQCLAQIGGEGFAECVIKPVLSAPLIGQGFFDQAGLSPLTNIITTEVLGMEYDFTTTVTEPCSGVTQNVQLDCPF